MATKAAHWKREGHSTVSSWIVADGAQKVIDFMTQVLNAETLINMPNEADKTVVHASLRIGETTVMIHDSNKEDPAVPTRLHVFVEDVDKAYELALSNGAVSVQAPKDEYYGDRMCGVKDSAGNSWWIATHKFNPEYPGKANE